MRPVRLEICFPCPGEAHAPAGHVSWISRGSGGWAGGAGGCVLGDSGRLPRGFRKMSCLRALSLSVPALRLLLVFFPAALLGRPVPAASQVHGLTVGKPLLPGVGACRAPPQSWSSHSVLGAFHQLTSCLPLPGCVCSGIGTPQGRGLCGPFMPLAAGHCQREW